MKEAVIIAVFALVVLLVNSGQNTGADDPEHKSAVHTSAKVSQQPERRQKAENSHSEWFPDPERGWVRVEPDQRPQKERDSSRVESPNRQKQSLWEY